MGGTGWGGGELDMQSTAKNIRLILLNKSDKAVYYTRFIKQ